MSQLETQTREETTISTPAAAQQTTRRTQTANPPVQNGSPQRAYQTKKAIFRTYQIVWYILGLIEATLAFRIILKMLGANPQSGFTRFINSVSSPFAGPFEGIVGTTGNSGAVIEWSTLIAMATFAVIAYGIVALLQLVKPTDQAEVERSVDNQ